MADKRKILKKGESIRLYSEEKKAALSFTVIKKYSVDENKIIYIGEVGRKKVMLTEFYPLTEKPEELMIRGENNCLFMPCEKKGKRALTKKEAAVYSEDYTALKKHIKNARSKNEFADIIPEFDILRGCDKNGKAVGTAYILTEIPAEDFVGFDKFARVMKSQATKNPEKSVFSLLLFIYTLAGAVEFLHSGGFSLGAQTLADTVIPAKNGNFRIEAARLGSISNLIVAQKGDENADNREFEEACSADIRALGLMLFGALTKKDEIPGGEYSDECCNMLQSIISSSELLGASPVTANYKLQNIIVKILKSSLASDKAKKPYDAAMMLSDIKSAAVFILPSEYTDATNLYKELKSIDKKLERYNEADSLFALKALLFNYPLYLENKDDTIRVAVIGFGVYGQAFLDIALQAGQMHGKKLDITVVTLLKDAYKAEYLASRPELSVFFDIDRDDESEGNYGKLTFIEPAELDERFRNGFSGDSLKLNRELTEALCEKNMPNYIFVAAGTPELNKRVAKAYMKYFDEKEHKCLVSFVYPEKLRADERNKNLVPVNVNAKSCDTLNYAQIERMAFNTFLLWYNSLNLNVDFNEAKKKFRKPYDYNSSVSCALSIKYKLYSLGIEIKNLSPAELLATARTYTDKLRREKEIFAGLVAAEHRRWVTEKLTGGWKCRKDLTVCLTDGMQNKRLKEHVCIVKSRADFLLSEKYISDNEWKNTCEFDSELDELDRMSVELHRLFCAKAQEKINSFTLHSSQESTIKSLIKDDKSASLAFNELMECLDEIWEFSPDAQKRYEGIKENFLSLIKGMSDEARHLIETEFDYIDMNAKPVIEACKKRNYKDSDTLIIEYLPFILTYKEDISVMVPLQTGSTTEIFNNVSHISVINPSEVTYLFYPDSLDALNEAELAVRRFLPYFKKNNLRTKVKLLAVCTSASEKFAKKVEEVLLKIKEADADSVINETRVMTFSSINEVAPSLKAQYGNLDLYERNKTFLCAFLWGAGFYDDVPSFSFTSSKKEFKANARAAWVTYIGGSQALDVDDMFSLNESVKTSERKSLTSNDYKALWSIYCSNRWAWKCLCEKLDDYRKNDVIVQFSSGEKDDSVKEYICIIPVESRDGYRRLISVMADEYGMIEKESRVEYNSIDSCKVTIVASAKYSKEIEKLFAAPEKFIAERNILFKATENSVTVSYNDLAVTACNIEHKKHHQAMCDILRKLESRHFISNLSFLNNNNEVTFRYSERQIKNILTCAGRVLELFVYNKLKNGNFDDVECDYEFSWGNTGDSEIISEMDCIVTKGFSSCIIESKATAELSQDYYFKLSSLASRFGVNTVPVIIASDLARDGGLYRTNKMQIERGRQLGVITVFMSPEIENIDKTIENILKGSYTQKTLAPFKK